MTDDVTLVATATPLTGKGGDTRFSLEDQYGYLAEWMRLRAYTHPIVFRVAGNEVMRFDTDGEIVIYGKARATSREAFGCFRAWMLYANRRADADVVYVDVADGDPPGRLYIGPVEVSPQATYVDGYPVSPETATLAIVKWVLG